MRTKKLSPRRQEVSDLKKPFEAQKERLEKLEKDQAKEKEIRERLREAANMVAASNEGLILLKYILDLSGHKKHKAVVDPTSGEINIQSTVYNVARESLYLSVSKLLDERNLRRVES